MQLSGLSRRETLQSVVLAPFSGLLAREDSGAVFDHPSELPIEYPFDRVGGQIKCAECGSVPDRRWRDSIDNPDLRCTGCGVGYYPGTGTIEGKDGR